MLGREELRRIVHLALMVWLFIQIGISVNKLAKKSLGTAEGSDHEDTVLYPSVTLCPSFTPGPDDDNAAQENLDNVYKNKLERFETRFLKLEHGTISEGSVYVDVPLGLDFSDLAEKGAVSETLFKSKQFVRCLTYNPPLRTKPGIVEAITIDVNQTGVQYVVVFLHNKDMFYPMLAEAAGSTHFVVHAPTPTEEGKGDKPILRYYSYEVTRTKWTLANVAEEPCDEKPRDMMACVNFYIEDTLKCNLPWTKRSVSGRETCNYTKLMDKMFDIFTMGTQQLHKETGCLGGCQYFQFETKQIYVEDEPMEYGESKMTLHLTINSGAFQAKEQYIIYDFSSFISDVGGYLGLLLGHSLLTMFDALTDGIAASKVLYLKRHQEKK